MIRERSELDAIASEIHASGQPIALDLETYGTSEDKKIRKHVFRVLSKILRAENSGQPLWHQPGMFW